MNYGVLFMAIMGFVFYYSGRFYLKKIKNISLPFLMERYPGNPKLNFLQFALYSAGLMIGYAILWFLYYLNIIS